MASGLNDFDGGTNGTTITTGNSGGASGNAWDVIDIQTGAVAVYASGDGAYQGGMGSKLETTGTASRAMLAYETQIGLISQDIWGRAYFKLSNNPTNEFFLFRARKDNSVRAIIALDTDGKLKTKNKNMTTVGTGASAVPLNQWVRIEWKFRFNDGTGHLALRLYNDPQAGIEDFTWKLENFTSDCGADANQFEVGVVNAIANVKFFYLDAVEWNSSGNGSFDFIGPISTPTQTVSPTGIATAQAFGTPTIEQGGVQNISAAGAIATAEAFGTPLVARKWQNSFDGGTDDTTITIGNSGVHGDAFDGTSIGSGETLIYDNEHVRSGLAMKVVSDATSGEAHVRYSTSIGTVTDDLYGRMYWYITGYPPAGQSNVRPWRARSTGIIRGGLQLLENGKLELFNAANTAVVTTINAIPLNQWVRIEWWIFFDGTAGDCELRVFNDADSTTATETLTIANTQNFAANANEFEFGITASKANIPAQWFDHIAMRFNDWLGPVVNPGTIAGAEVFGTPSVSITNFTINPFGIASEEVFGTVSVQLAALRPFSISSQEAFGTPIVVLDKVFPLGISSKEAFGTPAVILSTITPVGIVSAEAFGVPVITSGGLHPTGIGTREAFGSPTISLFNAYAGQPWDGLTLVDVHGIEGSTYFSVSIIDADETSFGDQALFEGAAGSPFTLRFEWISSRAGILPFPTTAVISFREPGTTTQIGGSSWIITTQLTGLNGVQTLNAHFDDNPLDEELGTFRTGRLEMHLYLENKVGTDPITWAASSTGFSGGSAPRPFNFARGELNATSDFIEPVGIASAQAFGTAVLTTTRTITNVGNIVSSETFGTAAVNPSAVPISVSSIPSAQAFGTPTVRGPNHFLTLTVKARRTATIDLAKALHRTLETRTGGKLVITPKTARSRFLTTRVRGKVKGVINVPFGTVPAVIKRILAMFGD